MTLKEGAKRARDREQPLRRREKERAGNHVISGHDGMHSGHRSLIRPHFILKLVLLSPSLSSLLPE